MERFVADYSERGFQFACGLCGNSEEAKELVQEAFCRVFRSWDRYDQSQPLDSWFLTILRNVYVDSVKRHERRFGVRLDAALVRDGEDGDTFSGASGRPARGGGPGPAFPREPAQEVRRALDEPQAGA